MILGEEKLFELFKPYRLEKAPYKNDILDFYRNILPQLSTREICELVMSDKALKRRWQKQIEIGLKKHQSQINFSEFISSSSPEASIVAACLVNRDTNRFSPEIILDELHKINYQDQQSKFSGDGGWIQNNLYGQLLYLYIGVRSKPNPLYAGFERFCILARGNLRFFQELCHQSFIIFESENFSLDDDELTTTIPIETQSLAAALTADKILTEIEHLGSLGPTLKLLIHRLGKIFELSQKRRPQSEPEITHFSISFDSVNTEENKKIQHILNEARTWAIIYSKKDTKNKGALDREKEDFIPNPIYAPFFGVSYRRKRKLTLSAREFLNIAEGSEESFKRLIFKYANQWSVEIDNFEQQDLFRL